MRRCATRGSHVGSETGGRAQVLGFSGRRWGGEGGRFGAESLRGEVVSYVDTGVVVAGGVAGCAGVRFEVVVEAVVSGWVSADGGEGGDGGMEIGIWGWGWGWGEGAVRGRHSMPFLALLCLFPRIW